MLNINTQIKTVRDRWKVNDFDDVRKNFNGVGVY